MAVLTKEEIDKKVEEYRKKLTEENKPIHLFDEDHITVTIKYLDREDNLIRCKEYYVDNIWSAGDALIAFFHQMNSAKVPFLFIGYRLSKSSKADVPIDIFVGSDKYAYAPSVTDLRAKDDDEEARTEDDEDED